MLNNTRIILLTFFLLSTSLLSAQDLIVTNSGDSINAKIIKIKKNRIYLLYKYKGVVRDTYLNGDTITSYQYRFYRQPDVPITDIMAVETDHWRVGLYGGWSWRIAQTSENLNSFERDYIEKLKRGHNYGADGAYFFNRYIGAGLVFNMFKASNSVIATGQLPNGNYVTGTLADDITIIYVGPSFVYRYQSRTKMNGFVLAASIGYTNYHDNAIQIDAFQLNSTTVGSAVEFCYDIGLSRHTAIGIGIAFREGILTDYDLTQNGATTHHTLNTDELESLLRIDLSLGVRFH